MEMHQIRYFLAVSNTLNFTRAAQDCYVAQPSLTRAIKLLEAELGGELFRRERNLTHLTDFGRRMLPLLRQSYESAQAAKNLATAIRSGAVASLTLALSQAISLSLLVAPLTELTRVFPGLQLCFLRGTAAEVVEFLKKGAAHLAVAGPLGNGWERIENWPLFVEEFHAVVGEEHAFAGSTKIRCSNLSGHHVLARPYCEMAEPLTEFLREHDIAWSSRHEVACEQDLVELVGAGLGIGLQPRSSAGVSGLHRLVIEDLEIFRPVSLYAVAGRERSAPTATLIKLLRARDWSADSDGATS